MHIYIYIYAHTIIHIMMYVSVISGVQLQLQNLWGRQPWAASRGHNQEHEES